MPCNKTILKDFKCIYLDCLSLIELPESTNSGSNGRRSSSANSPRTSSHSFRASLALPDADGLALDGVFSAEGAGVLCVLGDFHLLDCFTQRGTVADTVLSGHADFLGAFGHLKCEGVFWILMRVFGILFDWLASVTRFGRHIFQNYNSVDSSSISFAHSGDSHRGAL